MICRFCGTEYEDLSGLDYSEEGFFCDCCDCFTYFEQIRNKHKFNLLLEENGNPNTDKSEHTIQFEKHLSPLRYPGGKTKMLPTIYQNLNKNNTQFFVEPFAGGAGVGLSLLAANVIEHYVLNDIDYGIYSLFKIIKEHPKLLLNKLQTTTPTHKDYFKMKTIIQNNYVNCNILDAAWAMLITNRLSYSGIVKANPLGGKNGTKEQLLSRWNPQTLSHRIIKINSMSDRITVTNFDANKTIEDYYWQPHTTLFVDPPYYKKGKKLYTHYFNETQQMNLSEQLWSLSAGCPGADIVLTYDNEDVIKNLYWWADTQNIKLHYSV